jgi:uncharacterized protein YhaN
MKLSFFPGQLLLDTTQDGAFHVTVAGEEIFRTQSQRRAVEKFNSIRKEMEERFPPAELSQAEKAEAFKRMVLDSMVRHNSLGGRKKKSTAGGTRTFGG